MARSTDIQTCPLSTIVSNDGASAWIVRRQPDQAGAPPSLAEILEMLEASRIRISPAVYGRVEQYVELWDTESGDGVPSRYLVAEGTPPTEPEDDELELDEQFQATSSDPAGEGTVDHFARSMIKTVSAGTAIGRIKRGRAGSSGRDVFGREIPARRKSGAQVCLGHGLLESESGDLLAQVDGRLVIDGVRLKVEPRLDIRGDVDFDTGSLDACVDVEVRGTVKSNFRLRTSGSLTVGRAIEAAEIDVDGDLRVQGGICGREGAGSVRVGGSVAARFCNESNVEAGGDIRIETETLNSRVRTPAVFRSRGGTIIGGTIWAREGIEVSVLGSESGITTCVAVGASLGALREQRRIEQEIDGHEKLAAGIREKIAPLMANVKRLTPQQREAATELMGRANELDTAVDELQARRQQLHEQSRPNGTPYVLVNAACQPGVRIAFGAREARIGALLHGPVRIEERKIENATEIVAVNSRTGSVAILPSCEIDVSTPAP
jgi:uncharacterized protein (DUF342 family)